MIDRRPFIFLVAGTSLLEPLAANGQPQGKTARVGILAASPRESLQMVAGTIVDTLRELGYVEVAT